MNKVLLFNQIEALPAELQQQVAEFVAFLQFKHFRQRQVDELEFSEEDLLELDRCWEEYQSVPESAMEVGDFKNWVKTQYGV